MGKIFRVLFCMLTCILLVGCSQQSDKVGNNVDATTIKDSMGNVISLGKPFQRVASLAVSSDEMILDLLPLENIVGVTTSTMRGELSNAVSKAKLVANKLEVNSPESIYKVKPDLVIIPDFVKKEVIATLQDMGITVFVYKRAHSFAEVRENIVDVARVVGKDPQPLLNYMDSKQQSLNSKLKDIPESSKKRIVYLMSGGIYCNPKSPFQDMCKYAGLKDASLELGIAQKTHLSKEEMIKLNPDIIFVPDFNWDGKSDTSTKIKEILEDKAYQDVKAIKNRQVFGIPGKHLYCLSHYIVDASEDMARFAYPELFK